jgi:hypothetical protein
MDVLGSIKRAAEKCGLSRDRFNESRTPTDMAMVSVLPLFPDLRHTFIASSILLKRYREEEKGSKYFILCSWPGMQGLFPYVDEYWSIQDDHAIKKLYQDNDRFENRSDVVANCTRNLNSHFFDVIDPVVLKNFYDGGLTEEFFQRFSKVQRWLPMVPSVGVLGKDFGREITARAGYKVFLYPSLWMKTWRSGREATLPTQKEFWVSLAERLVKNKFVPVCYRSPWTHDLSTHLPSECIHVTDPDLTKVLGVMRSCGCVLDMFNGISRMALAARCPFLAVDERSRYANTKEWEIDDLGGPRVPKSYIFSFCTILDGTAGIWDDAIFNNVAARLESFLPELDRDNWPSTVESNDVVSYDSVRTKKVIKVGAKLLKIPKE